MTERTEERLRAALRAEAEQVDVDDGAWADVQRRVRANRPRRARRAAVLVAAAAVVAVALVGAVIVRDDGTVDVVPADQSTTSTTPVPVTTVDPGDFDGIWPFASQAQLDAYVADPGVGMFFDPVQTALEFAREYLDMPDPVAPRGFQPTEGFSGSVEVRPEPGSPMATRVEVHRYGGDEGAYAVYAAETANIEVDREAMGETVGTTIRLAGRSTAFEATVNVDVRDATGRSLATTFVMGGANGEIGPFEGEVTIDEPTTPSGAVVFLTYSAKDGSVQEATVVRVRFVTSAATTFSVFFHRGEQLVEVTRHGDATTGVLRQALEALVAGPRPDDGDGISSFFSADTAGVLAGVNLRDGTAIVDLAEAVNNASTSAGSRLFLEELDATVFQFPTVERVEYRLGGSCDAFWSWLQYGDCRVVDRPGSAAAPPG